MSAISQQFDLSVETNYLQRTMFLDPAGPVSVQRFEEVKYPKLQHYEQVGRGYFWNPEEVDLTKDKIDFKEATDAIKHIFTSNLLRQTSLDSSQGKTPALIFNPAVSIPELEALCFMWSFFETNIHSNSYSHIIRNIYGVPKDEFNKIHHNPHIVNMAASIGRYYTTLHRLNCKKELAEEFGLQIDAYEHKRAVYMALHASYALEAIRFMVSFATSLAMVENRIFAGNGNIISLILQDEILHKEFTAYIINTLEKDDPDFKQIKQECQHEVYQLYIDAIREEKDWAKFLFSKGPVIGLNEQIMCDYVDLTAYESLREIGIVYREQYPKTNPAPWMKKHTELNKKQPALQETESTDYVVGLVSDVIHLDELPTI